MGIIKIIVVAGIIYLAFQWLNRNKQEEHQSTHSNDSGVMKKCAQCNTHTPAASGVHENNLFFCSAEHQQAYKKSHP